MHRIDSEEEESQESGRGRIRIDRKITVLKQGEKLVFPLNANTLSALLVTVPQF